MGKSKSKSTVEPWKEAKPYILGASNEAQSIYNANKDSTANVASQIQSILPGMIDRYKEGSPALKAANAYNTDVLSGKYLDAGNPYLQQMIDSTGSDVRNGIQASLGTRGRTGGDSYFSIMSKALADNSSKLRYSDYDAERNRMSGAVSQVPGLVAAESASVSPILAAAQAGAELPYAGVNNYTANISRLLSPYTTQTNTQSQSFGSLLGNIAGSGLAGWASGGFTGLSDRRAKMDVQRVGQLEDGLGVYRYRYSDTGEPGFGVMADEVEQLRPWALGGETADGLQTVDYGAL